jgi:hypothetical protein
MTAKEDQRLAALGDHRRDDGVHRALGWADAVGVAGVDHETGAAILQHHAALWRHPRAAEAVVDRIDEADRGAVLVDHGEVGRVRMRQQQVRRHVAHGARRIDRGGQALGMRAGQQALHRHAHMLGIGDVAVALGIGQLARLDLGVEAVGGQRVRGQRRLREDVEQQQRGQSLARRRALPHRLPR